MTREECEQKLFDLLKQVRDVYCEYGTDGKMLSVCMDDEYINFFTHIGDKQNPEKRIYKTYWRKKGKWEPTTYRELEESKASD